MTRFVPVDVAAELVMRVCPQLVKWERLAPAVRIVDGRAVTFGHSLCFTRQTGEQVIVAIAPPHVAEPETVSSARAGAILHVVLGELAEVERRMIARSFDEEKRAAQEEFRVLHRGQKEGA